jgi:putative tryptophan/tyrosine transport system substrate-binding protein
LEKAMRRRNFIKGIVGSAAAWPLAVRAQQPGMPVIGFLHSASPDGNADRVRLFRQGLKEVGFVEGQNVAVEYRWAENQVERLPALADELVRRPVTVIAVAGQPATFAAKAATTTIPIACIVAEDPVRLGLVTSIARPTGNLTGVNFFPVELSAKRLELLRELTAAVRIAALADPNNTQGTSMVRDLETAAHALSLEIKVFNAGTSREIDAAFAGFARERPDALFVGTGPFFTDRRVQLALQAMLHRIPAAYPYREFVEVGGLISYGASLREAFRQLGDYTGRILKGVKPADLPVLQSSKFELVINHQTARMLGLTVPPTLLATADEVIE